MEEFRLGNDVTLKFDVLVNHKKVKPTNVLGSLLSTKNRFLCNIPASIEESEVTSIIPTEDIREVGVYTALFDVRLPMMGTVQHGVKFKIKPSVLKKRKLPRIRGKNDFK